MAKNSSQNGTILLHENEFENILLKLRPFCNQSMFLLHSCLSIHIVGSMVIAGCSVFLIALVNNTATTVASSCVFGGILVIGYGALDVLTLESYPTHLR